MRRRPVTERHLQFGALRHLTAEVDSQARNPYCAFANDKDRPKALVPRDIRLVITAIAAIFISGRALPQIVELISRARW